MIGDALQRLHPTQLRQAVQLLTAHGNYTSNRTMVSQYGQSLKGYRSCSAIRHWQIYLLMGDMKSLQALFGGTFDPVHYGHLKPVETLANLLGLSRVIIMPNQCTAASPPAGSLQRAT
ncbi:nicotinate-nucleotide adenylyltransferase [Salmonella bongori]|nr:nicotinate-nucleotide adenylyltransferase [Salmonella bongori]